MLEFSDYWFLEAFYTELQNSARSVHLSSMDFKCLDKNNKLYFNMS